jgi:hypothetical protein
LHWIKSTPPKKSIIEHKSTRPKPKKDRSVNDKKKEKNKILKLKSNIESAPISLIHTNPPKKRPRN